MDVERKSVHFLDRHQLIINGLPGKT